MGNALYEIIRNGQTIQAGYAVATHCERTNCGAAIDRGLAHLCGETPGGTQTGCGGYFCESHLYSAPGDQSGSRCADCLLRASLPEDLLQAITAAARNTDAQPTDPPDKVALRAIAAALPYFAGQARAAAQNGPEDTTKSGTYLDGYCDAAVHLAERLEALGPADTTTPTGTSETIFYTADVVVTTTDGYVLLIKRRWDPFKGQWALPGGHVDPGETGRQAAARELGEEAGVYAAPEELTQLGEFDRPDRDPRGRYVTVAYHLTVIPGTAVKAGSDATNAQWWPASDLPPLAFDHADILSAAVGSAS